MPKSIFISISVVFTLVVILSVASNFQQSSLLEKDSKTYEIAFLESQQREWKNILLGVPQYKPSNSKKATQNSAKTEVQKSISDSTIVGIVLDEPSSILLTLKDSKEIQYLSIGEGWLGNWVIETLQADTVTWFNTDTQEQYIQPLFELTKAPARYKKKRNAR